MFTEKYGIKRGIWLRQYWWNLWADFPLWIKESYKPVLSIFSDSCTGPTKNRIVVVNCKYPTLKGLMKIDPAGLGRLLPSRRITGTFQEIKLLTRNFVYILLSAMCWQSPWVVLGITSLHFTGMKWVFSASWHSCFGSAAELTIFAI